MKGYYTSAAAVAFLIASCVSRPPKPDPIPVDLIPQGFTVQDCHWQDPSDASAADAPHGGGLQFSGGTGGRHIACHKKIKQAPETRCVDAQGKEKPMEQCK